MIFKFYIFQKLNREAYFAKVVALFRGIMSTGVTKSYFNIFLLRLYSIVSFILERIETNCVIDGWNSNSY